MKCLMNIIYLSINYTDKQTSPSVLPVFWGCARKPLFSQRLSAVFKRYLLLLLSLPPSCEDHIRCLYRKSPPLWVPQLRLERHQSAPVEPARPLSRHPQPMRVAFSRCVFPIPWLRIAGQSQQVIKRMRVI